MPNTGVSASGLRLFLPKLWTANHLRDRRRQRTLFFAPPPSAEHGVPVSGRVLAVCQVEVLHEAGLRNVRQTPTDIPCRLDGHRAQHLIKLPWRLARAIRWIPSVHRSTPPVVAGS